MKSPGEILATILLLLVAATALALLRAGRGATANSASADSGTEARARAVEAGQARHLPPERRRCRAMVTPVRVLRCGRKNPEEYQR